MPSEPEIEMRVIPVLLSPDYSDAVRRAVQRRDQRLAALPEGVRELVEHADRELERVFIEGSL